MLMSIVWNEIVFFFLFHCLVGYHFELCGEIEADCYGFRGKKKPSLRVFNGEGLKFDKFFPNFCTREI